MKFGGRNVEIHSKAPTVDFEADRGACRAHILKSSIHLLRRSEVIRGCSFPKPCDCSMELFLVEFDCEIGSIWCVSSTSTKTFVSKLYFGSSVVLFN